MKMELVTQRAWHRWHRWNVRAGLDHELPLAAVVTAKSAHRASKGAS